MGWRRIRGHQPSRHITAMDVAALRQVWICAITVVLSGK